MRPSKFANHLIERSSELMQRLPGAAAENVHAMRSAAITRFGNIGLPTLRDEAWRYTNVQPLGRLAFEPARKTEVSITEEEIKRLNMGAIGAARIVFC